MRPENKSRIASLVLSAPPPGYNRLAKALHELRHLIGGAA
jgi:hypothetical protein